MGAPLGKLIALGHAVHLHLRHDAPATMHTRLASLTDLHVFGDQAPEALLEGRWRRRTEHVLNALARAKPMRPVVLDAVEEVVDASLNVTSSSLKSRLEEDGLCEISTHLRTGYR